MGSRRKEGGKIDSLFLALIWTEVVDEERTTTTTATATRFEESAGLWDPALATLGRNEAL